MSSPLDQLPTEAELRARLLQAAQEFSRVTNIKKSAIGLKALNDANFIFRVEDGEDFRLSSYRRITEFLRRNWPRDTVPAE